MPCSVDVQSGPVLARLEGMLSQIAQFKRKDLGDDALEFWQTEDMRRDQSVYDAIARKGNGDDDDPTTLALRNAASALAQRRFVRAKVTLREVHGVGQANAKTKTEIHLDRHRAARTFDDQRDRS